MCHSNYNDDILSSVIGFAEPQYRLEEKSDPQQLVIQVLSPPQSLVRDVGIEVSAMDGTAISELLLVLCYAVQYIIIILLL